MQVTVIVELTVRTMTLWTSPLEFRAKDRKEDVMRECFKIEGQTTWRYCSKLSWLLFAEIVCDGRDLVKVPFERMTSDISEFRPRSPSFVLACLS